MVVRLWVDKYRPNTLDDFVWRDQKMRAKVEEWLKQKSLPHLMFTGPSGTGKTSLSRMLMHLLEIPKADVMTKNASSTKESGVNSLEMDIQNFASTYAFGPTEMKYVLMDEADRLSYPAQQFLRGEVEKEENFCRFIFTANDRSRIHYAIMSRCIEIQFLVLDKDDFITRAGEILVRENVDFSLEDLEAHVALTYPDLRKCINLMEGNVLQGKLLSPKAEDQVSADYLLKMAELFQQRKFNEGRKVLIENTPPDEYPSVFRFLYKQIDSGLWGTTHDQQTDALLIIRQGLVNHSIIADPEINLSATIVELVRNMDMREP